MVDQERLLKVLCKITFRSPDDDWDLTEDEYDILDATRGEEIMSIAYKNKLNPLILIKNADQIIEQHNTKTMHNYHNTIRSLKQDFISEVPKRRLTTKENKDSDEIERRIIAEVIEEVAGFANNNNLNAENLEAIQGLEEVDIRPLTIGVVTRGGTKRQTCSDLIEANSVAQNSNPSLHRNGQSFNNPQITLTEVIPRVIPDLDTLPEPTNEDAVELGLYTIPNIGRQVFDIINAPKIIASTPLNLQPTPSVSKSGNVFEAPEVSAMEISPQVMVTTVNDTPNTLAQKQIDEPSVDLVTDQVVPTEKSSQNGRSREVRSQKLRENSNHVARNILHVENTRVSSNGKGVENENLTLQRQILESVRKELIVDDKMVQKQRKKRVRRPRKRSVSPSNRIPTQQLHKELIFHPKKTTNIVRPPYRTAIHFQDDIFEGLDNYVVFQRDLEPIDIASIVQSLSIENQEVSREVERNEIQGPNEIEIPVVIQAQGVNLPSEKSAEVSRVAKPVQQSNREDMEFGMNIEIMNFAPGIPTSTPRPSILTELPIQMRPSVVRDAAQTSFLNVPSENITPIDLMQAERVSVQNANITKDIPVSTIKPSNARTSQISAKDVEFAKLSHISRKRLRQSDSDADQNLQQLPEKKTKAHFIEVNGKTEKLVKVVGFEKVETYSKYCLETICLLFQIRIVLRRNNYKGMKVSELISQLSLLNPQADARIFKRRIDFLADYQLLKVTFTDDNDIDEVQI